MRLMNHTKNQIKTQYKKFGNYIPSLGGESGSGQPNDPINSTDWRVAGSLVFYITFALLAAAMSTVEQKNGLRYSLALAVVFCLNEVQWLMEVNKENEEGYKPSQQTMVLSQFFPPTFCMFEKINIMHLLYFLCFNIICTISKIFGVDEHKRKISVIRQVIDNQEYIEKSLRDIYRQMVGEEYPDKTYMRTEQKEYRKWREGETTKRMQLLLKGKNEMEMSRHQTKITWAKRACVGGCILYVIFKKIREGILPSA
eukprot:403366980